MDRNLLKAIKMKKQLLITLYFILCSFLITNAQQVEWVKEIHFSDVWNRSSSIKSISADKQGNVIIAGYYRNGDHTTQDKGIFLGKYDLSGSILWMDTIEASAYCTGMVIGDNYIYIAGNCNSGQTMQFDNFTLFNPNTARSIFIVKYDLEGNVIWANMVLNTSSYKIGFFNNELYHMVTRYNDSFIDKYSTDGTSIWSKNLNAGSAPTDFSISDENNIFVALKSAIIKYNSNLDLIWSREVPGYSITALSSDKKGNCYMAGSTMGDITIGNTALYAGNDSFCRFVAKMDSAGNYVSAFQAPLESNTYALHNSGESVFCAGDYVEENSNGAVGSVLSKFTKDSLDWYVKINPYNRPASIITDEYNVYVGGYLREELLTAFLASIKDNTYTPTSIKKNTIENSLNIYPNPTGSIFNVIYSSPGHEQLQINIRSITGQVIYSESILQFQGEYRKAIDLSKQAKGLYFIEIAGDKNKQVKKIVVN